MIAFIVNALWSVGAGTLCLEMGMVIRVTRFHQELVGISRSSAHEDNRRCVPCRSARACAWTLRTAAIVKACFLGLTACAAVWSGVCLVRERRTPRDQTEQRSKKGEKKKRFETAEMARDHGVRGCDRGGPSEMKRTVALAHELRPRSKKKRLHL